MESSDGKAGAVIYVLAMVGVIVAVDVLFLKHHFWERLLVNIAIVAAFATVYARLFKRP